MAHYLRSSSDGVAGGAARTGIRLTSQVAARRGALGLGVGYVLLGIMETIRLTVTGDGGFLFWFGTLVGGGALLLYGAWSHSAQDGRHFAAVLLGTLVGVPATMWTLVVPVSAVAVAVITVLAYAAPEPSGHG